MKWVVLATAPDQLSAEMWQDRLREEGIPAMIKPGDVTSFLGVTSVPCRVMVPEDRLGEAQEMLAEFQ
ncbi:MAG: DUF2007 domain-containing protein [Chloroflexi bacterium]|nr:DUF2007 domain-containing protein [Chloroflexota bacterium]